MTINYISKSAEECKKLEDAMDVFQQNYRLVSNSPLIGVSLESTLEYVKIFPFENDGEMLSINSVVTNPSGKFFNYNATSIKIEIGETTYVVNYKNPNSNKEVEKK